MIPTFEEQTIELEKSISGVAEESFDSGYKVITDQYGGIDKYLRNQIMLTEEEISKFREYYLE